MKARVLHVDLAMFERGVLHLRRERMRDRIAKHAETKWRINIAHRFRPILEIGECVPLRHLLSLHLERHALLCPKSRTRRRASLQFVFISRRAEQSSGRTARAHALSPSPPTCDKG